MGRVPEVVSSSSRASLTKPARIVQRRPRPAMANKKVSDCSGTSWPGTIAYFDVLAHIGWVIQDQTLQAYDISKPTAPPPTKPFPLKVAVNLLGPSGGLAVVTRPSRPCAPWTPTIPGSPSSTGRPSRPTAPASSLSWLKRGRPGPDRRFDHGLRFAGLTHPDPGSVFQDPQELGRSSNNAPAKATINETVLATACGGHRTSAGAYRHDCVDSPGHLWKGQRGPTNRRQSTLRPPDEASPSLFHRRPERSVQRAWAVARLPCRRGGDGPPDERAGPGGPPDPAPSCCGRSPARQRG